MPNPHVELSRLLVMLAGNDQERRASALKRHTIFQGDDGTDRWATSISSMSSRWCEAAIGRIKKAIREGEENCIFDEHGNRTQLDMFGGE